MDPEPSSSIDVTPDEPARSSDVVAPTYHVVAALSVRHARPQLLHSGMTLEKFFSFHLAGISLPVVAGLLLYGWRALGVMALVVAAALCTIPVWRQIGSRGKQMRYSHSLYLALLLSLMLPAHWCSVESPYPPCPRSLWMLAVAAGILLTFITWLTGGVGSGRVHPVLAAYLVLVVFFSPALEPHWVLQRTHLVAGDAARAANLQHYPSTAAGWIDMDLTPLADFDALALRPASSNLIEFTSAQERPERARFSVTALLSDQMPPLEDLIVGGQPGPIGATSAIAVIVGGLFLLYRGVADYRIPLIIILSTFAALLVLPIPVDFIDAAPLWQWLPLRHGNIGIAAALTFANYEILAGPLLLMAFFLATTPSLRPMTRRGRFLFAILAGILAAGAQLYVSVAFGAYVALVIASAFTPLFDRMFRPHTLV